jgi:hypothetical protein
MLNNNYERIKFEQTKFSLGLLFDREETILVKFDYVLDTSSLTKGNLIINSAP